ncbi:MAG: hypothetical protein QM503_11055 [Bacteroidota bacterium]
MGLKNSIKKKIAEFIMKFKVLPEKTPSGKQVDISSNRIVLFFMSNSNEEFAAIQLFLQSSILKEINIASICIYSNIEDDINHNIDTGIALFSQSDFNIVGGMKVKLNDYVISNKFDVLISFAVDSNLYCDKIISNISSDFKAGGFIEQNANLFDLTIKHNFEDYNKQLKQFIHYLDNLKINI